MVMLNLQGIYRCNEMKRFEFSKKNKQLTTIERLSFKEIHVQFIQQN